MNIQKILRQGHRGREETEWIESVGIPFGSAAPPCARIGRGEGGGRDRLCTRPSVEPNHSDETKSFFDIKES